MADISLEEVFTQLYDINGIQTGGEYTLKSGIKSPLYFDLRVIFSQPKLVKKVASLMWQTNPYSQDCDVLCGVPYAALPLGAVMSILHDKPLIFTRKEAKSHGKKKLVEGVFKPGDKCMVVEDVITSGSSLLRTVELVRNEGLVVEDVVVFLDREQGGKALLEQANIRVHTVTNVTTMMSTLQKLNRVTSEEVSKVLEFIKMNQINSMGPKHEITPLIKMSYEERMPLFDLGKAGIWSRLFQVMVDKKSNLCLAADFSFSSDLLWAAEHLGPFICMLKTHVDELNDWSLDVAKKLRKLADCNNFLLFEDKKFCDIGQTVSHQYHEGLFRISSWADLVTVHGIPGPDVFNGLQARRCPIEFDSKAKSCYGWRSKGAVIVAEMSCDGNLIDANYTKRCIDMQKKFSHLISDYSEDWMEKFVPAIGFVSQRRLLDDPECIIMIPGVKEGVEKQDEFKQMYMSVEKAILERGADIIIVGRGITLAGSNENCITKCKEYQEKGWGFYLKRIS